MPSDGSLPTQFDMFGHVDKWRHGGHRGPMTAAQKKKKAKARKKRKSKK